MSEADIVSRRPGGRDVPDGRAAWLRLATCLALSAIGGVGMWSVVVALPAVAADFDVPRGSAALSYTLAMTGFGIGGVIMGRLADRSGIIVPMTLGCMSLAVGYVAAAFTSSIFLYAFAHVVVGFGSSASFGPLLAHVSLWFVRRRGIAVAICASGNYLAGVIWPPLVQHFVEVYGWRASHVGIGLACLVLMAPLLPRLRRRPDVSSADTNRTLAPAPMELPVGPRTLQVLLAVAGVSCCVAMAMPQVHIVAYCGDLGYGVARGAQMLSLMLGFGIVSRVGSGFVADRIGGLPTLLLGSALQGSALVLYFFFDGLAQLYVISALFGLFQGGIVPAYAIIVREYYPAREVGARVGICIMATVAGMALGGWISGWVFDQTGSYRAAFLNGLAWNLLNGSIAVFLLMGRRRRSDVALT